MKKVILLLVYLIALSIAMYFEIVDLFIGVLLIIVVIKLMKLIDEFL